MGKFKDIWNREKDGSKKEQRSFLRVVIVATILFVLFLVFKKNSVIDWVEAGFTIKSQQKEIVSRQEQIDALDAKIRLLSNDRDSLEQYAREKYHFAEPGDDVYLLPE